MRLHFLGGADEVGGSCLLIEMAGKRVLIDAGARPSPKARAGLAGDQLPDLGAIDRAGGLDAVLVTHAHLDHTGALELLLERYPRVPVYATDPTIALTRVLHQDARHVARLRLESEGELPPYDGIATARLLNACVPVQWGQRYVLGPDLAAVFLPAGHIAGASAIGLESGAGRILISGDISITPQRTVDGMPLPDFVPDVLVLEATYGNKLHAHRETEEQRLIAAIAQIVAAGGKVLVPAFALGRAQEILLLLAAAQQDGRLPARLRVRADGMVRAVCKAYQEFRAFLAPGLRLRGAGFFGGSVHPITRPAQRAALLASTQPAVIVSSSGMLAGGPAVYYARALAQDPRNAIFLTGYQDEESPGRRLLDLAQTRSGRIWLDGEEIEVACRLDTYSLSAHADSGQLLGLAQELRPAQIFLVHGEHDARGDLARALRDRGLVVMLPRNGEAYAVQSLPPRPALQTQPGEPRNAAQGTSGANAAVPAAPPAAPGNTRSNRGNERRRKRMAALPILSSHWLVLRIVGEAYRFRLAVATTAEPEGFYVAGDRLLHGPEEVSAVLHTCPVDAPQQVLARIAAAEALAAVLAAAPTMPALLPSGQVRSPADLAARIMTDPGRAALPPVDESGVETEDVALAAVCLAAWQTGAEYVQGGYAYGIRAAAGERMDPNQALAFARALFPPGAGVRRIGHHAERAELRVAFTFPHAAQPRYAVQLERLQRDSGWRVVTSSEPDQRALITRARDLLIEAGVTVVLGPVYRPVVQQVAATVACSDLADLSDPRAQALVDAVRQFKVETGLALALELAGDLAEQAGQIT